MSLTTSAELFMDFWTSSLERFLNLFAHLRGRHVIVMADAPSRKLLDWESRTDGANREYFGLGLHVIVSPSKRSDL